MSGPDEERVFIVTGAGGGLGVCVVAQLAARGVRVLAVDLDPELAARALPERGLAGEVVPHGADVGDAESTKGFVAAALERWGRLDGIFNNAAVEGPLTGPITDYPDEDFDRVLRVNLRGVWLGMKYAIPALLANGGGAIVNTASMAGLKGAPTASGYSAAKAGLVNLTRTVALEFAKQNIRANVVSPGPMATAMIERISGRGLEEARERFAARIPIGRVGEPEEVATVVTFLLLDAPGYLTAAVIPVDGGSTAG